MSKQPHSFKRLVLGLQPTAADRTIRLVVELADLLHLELLGLFLEDTNLRDFASIPFAREFRPLGGGWHSIDRDQLSHDIDLAARGIERRFIAAAKHLATSHQFEVIRGPMAETIITISRTDDIVVIVEPVSSAERATQQSSRLLKAAFRSAAAVLLLPPRIARTNGPIAAIATSADDPSIHVAAAIAIAAKEELVIIEADGNHAEDARTRALTTDAGLKISWIATAKAGLPDPATCAQAFRHVQERLLVMTRGAFQDDLASTIAAARQVPVLVIEPQPDAKTAH